jgi:CHAD domain-containing protein
MIQQEVEGVKTSPQDIEHVHQVRVACRRFRSVLPIVEEYFPGDKLNKWNRQIRKLANTFGTARDLDVQIEYVNELIVQADQKKYLPGLRRIVLRLSQARQKKQVKYFKSLDSVQSKKTLDDIQTVLYPVTAGISLSAPYPGELYLAAARAITHRLKNIQACDGTFLKPQNSLELHLLRIETKRLRYTLEMFAPLYGQIIKSHIHNTKQIQDYLGIIHDCDVWSAFLPPFIENEQALAFNYFGHILPFKKLIPGFQYYQSEINQRRQTYYQEFLTQWNQIKESNHWEVLQSLVEKPVYPLENFYPPLG